MRKRTLHCLKVSKPVVIVQDNTSIHRAAAIQPALKMLQKKRGDAEIPVTLQPGSQPKDGVLRRTVCRV